MTVHSFKIFGFSDDASVGELAAHQEFETALNGLAMLTLRVCMTTA
jgi:hypothetical protein